MANYSELLNDINAAIYENNDQEIDALEVRAILREMVTSLGSGFLFKGIATPSGPTGTGTYEPDQNVFYLATTAGTYTYLGGLVVAAGEVAFLCYDGTWTKKPSALLSTGSIADNLTTNDATKVLSAKQGKVLCDNLTELVQRLYQQVTEDGWHLVDEQMNVALKYDADGLDAAKISDHFKSLLGGGGGGGGGDFIQVTQDGVFFVDENLNIGVYIDTNGIHANNILEYQIVNL